MKSMLLVLAAAGGIVIAGTAVAQSGADLAKSKNCMNCHDLEKKKVGPAFKEIAAKKPDAAKLIAALKEGKGHPVKADATDAELKTLVGYVLSQK
jgi:cytochrome c